MDLRITKPKTQSALTTRSGSDPSGGAMMAEAEEAASMAAPGVVESPHQKGGSMAGATLVFFGAFVFFIAARFCAK